MDELIKSILKECEKRSEEMKKTRNNTSMNRDELVEIKKDVTYIAKHTKMQYDQFVAVGFTEEQAMDLTIALLN